MDHVFFAALLQSPALSAIFGAVAALVFGGPWLHRGAPLPFFGPLLGPPPPYAATPSASSPPPRRVGPNSPFANIFGFPNTIAWSPARLPPRAARRHGARAAPGINVPASRIFGQFEFTHRDGSGSLCPAIRPAVVHDPYSIDKTYWSFLILGMLLVAVISWFSRLPIFKRKSQVVTDSVCSRGVQVQTNSMYSRGVQVETISVCTRGVQVNLKNPLSTASKACQSEEWPVQGSISQQQTPIPGSPPTSSTPWDGEVLHLCIRPRIEEEVVLACTLDNFLQSIGLFVDWSSEMKSQFQVQKDHASSVVPPVRKSLPPSSPGDAPGSPQEMPTVSASALPHAEGEGETAETSVPSEGVQKKKTSNDRKRMRAKAQKARLLEEAAQRDAENMLAGEGEQGKEEVAAEEDAEQGKIGGKKRRGKKKGKQAEETDEQESKDEE